MLPTWLKYSAGTGVALLLVALLVACACAWMMRRYTTYAPLDISPADCGLTFIPFRVRGAAGASLACWFIPAAQPRAVLIASHGVADSKSGMLPYLLPYQRAGFSLVLYDLRHHGESGGRDCTLGYWETRDLLDITRQVRADYANGLPIAYWGFSLGATTALLAAARDPHIMAVVAQSPFVSLRETVRHYAWRFFHVPAPLAALGVRIFEWHTGTRADDVDVPRIAAALTNRPILLIGSPHDQQVPCAWLERLHSALPAAELLLGPFGHDDGMPGNDTATNACADTSRALAFLAAALNPEP
jgi:alpha-beta hydrolase superfamily lysophospholipase